MGSSVGPSLVSSGIVYELDASTLSNVNRNFLTFPEDLTNAVWGKSASGTATAPVVIADYAPSPDGTGTADLVTFVSGGSGNSAIDNPGTSSSPTIGTIRTFSVWMRTLSGTTDISMYNGDSVQTVTVTASWQRFSYTVTITSGVAYGTRLAKREIWGTGGTASVLIWGAQWEDGSSATPYYPVSGLASTTWQDLSSNQYIAKLGNPLLSSVEVLVVAGGGAGGCGEGNLNGDGGAGGGGGGVIYTSNFPVTAGTSYSVSVGAGGAGNSVSSVPGGSGGNSTFGSLIAIGGGGGGGGDYTGSSVIGGCGGGASREGGVDKQGGSGTLGQGFAGGSAVDIRRGAGGGGGAGGIGENLNGLSFGLMGPGGNGGIGFLSNISGTATYYSGGGGGAPSLNFSFGTVFGGQGGLGGGASILSTGGNPLFSVSGANGTNNTGGGGAGGYGAAGGNGGSGIVIVRYPGNIQKATGGTVTFVNNYTIHTFTAGTDNFTPYNYSSPRYSAAYGGCIVLNGVDQVVDLGVSAYNLGIRRSATFAGWMMSNSTFAYLVSDWDGLGMTLRFNSLSSADFYVYGSNRRITATYTFAVNTWYNIVGVMDGDNMYMYINGVLVGTQTLGEDIGASSRTLKIGARGDYSPPSSAQQIGSLQIYKRALSASEILNNFNALRSRYGI